MESQSYRKLTKSYLKFGRTLNSLSITDQILNDKDVELVHISRHLNSMNKSKSNGTSNGINESLNNSMNFLQKSLQKVNGQIDGTPDSYQRAPSRPSEEFEQFSKKHGFTHHKTVPLNPRQNGEVEVFMKKLKRTVQLSMKLKLNFEEELNRQLQAYRATPHSTTGKSPAELAGTEDPSEQKSSWKKIDESYKSRKEKAIRGEIKKGNSHPTRING